MLAGARDVILVVRSNDLDSFQRVLGAGEAFGIRITYLVQDEPRGIADGLLRCEKLVHDEQVLLILGDNIFHGPLLGESLRERVSTTAATIFSYEVSDPRDYACVEIDVLGQPMSLVEKPVTPRSNLAVPGMYFLPPDSLELAKRLKPSGRGELEITDLNNIYLKEGRLLVVPLPRGTSWMDTGSAEALNEASNYVRILQQRQGLPIACPEEVAIRNGWIDRGEVMVRMSGYPNTAYTRLLSEVITKEQGRG